MSSTFNCFPVCKACRVSGICATVVKKEELASLPRKNPHAGSVRLPCGCLGLPWPIVEVFAKGIKEIHCDRHGWKKVTDSHQKTWRNLHNEMANRQISIFPDEPPY